MDALSWGVFFLTLLGICYSTVFAYYEYYLEQRAELHEMFDRIAHEEVMQSYVWPTLCNKMEAWGDDTLRSMQPSADFTFGAFSRRLYCNLRRQLRLSETEYEQYRQRCADRLVKRLGRWTLCGTAAIDPNVLDDVCASYVWQRLPVHALWDYLGRI